MRERGQIRNHGNVHDADFSGLRYGNITPTDVDGMIEYHGKAFVFIELKQDGAELKSGQERAFKTMCDTLDRASAWSVFIVADWHELDYKGEIPAETAIVRWAWSEGQRFEGDGNTLRNWIDRFQRRSGVYFDPKF